MKKIFILIVTFISFHGPAFAFLETETATLQLTDMRFYSVKALPLQSEERLDLVAAGQIKETKGNAALIIAFSITKGNFKEIAREVFNIGPPGRGSKTRIRSMSCIRTPSAGKALIVVNGKAGPENREVGFIRSYILDRAFKRVDSIEFSDPQTSYTHGYPLIQADMNGDGKNELICGGFSGDNDRDHADIRAYSIDKVGHLAPFKGIRSQLLNTLRLRINAMTAWDVNQDGASEVVAAGRTVENDVERAAFTVFADRPLVWKQLNDLGSCRYRYATVTDINRDGQPELILGGRIDQGGISYALLDVWQTDKGAIRLISRYRFTGPGSTRLRIVQPMPGSAGDLIIGGRMETLQDGGLRWKGFLQQITLDSGFLAPSSKAVILDKDWETRVRTMDIYDKYLIAAGFTKGKAKADTAFISVYQLK